MIDIYFGIGVFGLLGATLLFPAIGMLLPKNEISRIPSFSGHLGGLSIQVVIPTLPGSSAQLARTLSSLRDVVWPDSCEVTVHIAIDGEDSDLAQLATFCGATYSQRRSQGGKWSVLREAALQADRYTWVAFVDAGTLFPRSFGRSIYSHMLSPSIVGLFPSYRVQSGSLTQRVLWWVERTLKQFENALGGTISSHGAAVFYRGGHIKRVFAFLGDRQYANDDVVLPLLSRILAPASENHYLAEISVIDSDVSEGASGKRRKRLMLGNLEWISDFLPLAIRTSPRLALVTLRRVFRTFWAYWIAFLVFSTALWSPALVLCGIISITCINLFSDALKDLFRAFHFSLESPFRLFFLEEGYQWK